MDYKDEVDVEIQNKIRDRNLKNAIVKAIRKNQIEKFKISLAVSALATMYLANAYSQTSKLLDQHDRKKAMKSVIEEDWGILHDKDNLYEGLLDSEGYPRAWGYKHQNIGKKLNEYYATSQDLGDIHLADIANLIEYDTDNQNIDKVFRWVDDKYVGDAKSFQEYYQSLGYSNEQDYYKAMVDLNYEKSREEQEDVGGPRL